ncbi:MAG: aldose epimerase family protein [Paludibacter sp.]
MKIEKINIARTVTGEEIILFKFTCISGAYIEVTNYGATWVSAVMPDKNGYLSDVILGYNNLTGYLNDTAYLGSTVGRFANRIGNAHFHLNGVDYNLDKNDGENTNHGGFAGFNKKVFDYLITENNITFSLNSSDGEGGFPGNIKLNVIYSFSEDLVVSISYHAESDKDTYLNLTNHSYFNLHSSGNILGHLLYIPATEILDTDESFIPTGKFIKTENSVFDFSNPRPIGMDIFKPLNQLINNRGYNHCYVLGESVSNLKLAAILKDPESGRKLTVFTTKPAVLIYSAGFLNTIQLGKNGYPYLPYSGVCIETQYFPDSPNQPNFPDFILKKGELYLHKTEYRFEIEKI